MALVRGKIQIRTIYHLRLSLQFAGKTPNMNDKLQKVSTS